jgi:hypothetical protein
MSGSLYPLQSNYLGAYKKSPEEVWLDYRDENIFLGADLGSRPKQVVDTI